MAKSSMQAEWENWNKIAASVLSNIIKPCMQKLLFCFELNSWFVDTAFSNF